MKVILFIFAVSILALIIMYASAVEVDENEEI